MQRMMNIPTAKAPSRLNKKQLAAHVGLDVAEKMKAYCRREELSLTEIIAMSVNEAVSEFGAGPMLQVSRERLVNRVRSPSQVQTKGPDCRKGTKRIAGFYAVKDVERVAAFAREKGTNKEKLVLSGLRKILSLPPDPKDLPAKPVKAA